MENTSIVLKETNIVGRGAFAWVLRGPGGLAYKIFKAAKHRDRVGEEPYIEAECRAVFELECSAFKKIAVYEKLAAHVPAAFERIAVAHVLDPSGNDVSTEYMLNCCYRMEVISGTPEKLTGGTRNTFPWVRAFTANLADIGVTGTNDCSVFFRECADSFQIIDFSERPYETTW
jgi:hypothetical protein